MRTVASLLQSALKINIPAQVELSFYDSTDEYIRLQKEQLSEGLLNDGEQIYNVKTGSFQYSPGYAKYKGKSEPIDLRDTGDFYGGINIERQSQGSFKIESDDDKNAMLQKDYGKAIFGLADERLQSFASVAKAKLASNITDELNRV